MQKKYRTITPSAGIILMREVNQETYVLLLRFKDYWEFPKGTVEEGENKLEAAIRELKEEAGITNISFDWGKVFYETRPYGLLSKKVAYFIAKTNDYQVRISPNPNSGDIEHDEYRWVTIPQAYKLLGPRLSTVLRWAETRLYVVSESLK